MKLADLLRALLTPPWRTGLEGDADLMRQLAALGQQPTPEPDPDTIARLDQHLADCRARLDRLRRDLDQLEEDAR